MAKPLLDLEKFNQTLGVKWELDYFTDPITRKKVEMKENYKWVFNFGKHPRLTIRYNGGGIYFFYENTIYQDQIMLNNWTSIYYLEKQVVIENIDEAGVDLIEIFADGRCNMSLRLNKETYTQKWS